LAAAAATTPLSIGPVPVYVIAAEFGRHTIRRAV